MAFIIQNDNIEVNPTGFIPDADNLVYLFANFPGLDNDYLFAIKWDNYITLLSSLIGGGGSGGPPSGAAGGDLSGTYPNPVITNTTVINKALSTFVLGANTSVTTADTIVQAFGKTQRQINSLNTQLSSLNLQQVTTIGNTTSTNIELLNSQLQLTAGTFQSKLRTNSSNGYLQIGNSTNAFWANLNSNNLVGDTTYVLPSQSGTLALEENLPIFLDETSTIADFETGKTYYYIGEATIIYDYDLLPYPVPNPVSGFNLINLSVHNVTINSDTGNSTYILTPNQRLRDVQVTDDGDSWSALPTEYIDNIYDLQQVTDKGPVTTNAIVVRNNPDNYRTRYSIIGQQVQYDVGDRNVDYTYNRIQVNKPSNLASWTLNFPNIDSNTPLSNTIVNFRPNVSGTVAYLSDLSGAIGSLQQVTNVGNTTTNSIIVDEGLGTGTITINPVTNNILVDDLLGNVSEITPTGFFVTDATNNMGVSANNITFNTSTLTIRDSLSGTIALLNDIENTVTTINTNQTLSSSSNINVYLVNASISPISISLPSASSSTNKIIKIKKIDSSVNVVTVNTTETIDGNNSVPITTQWFCLSVVSDGFNWYII